MLDFNIHDFHKWCRPDDPWRFTFYGDYDKVVVWLNHLKTKTKEQSHLALIDLLLDSFKLEEEERPTASDLFARLREMPMFVGECCAIPQSRPEPSVSLSTNVQSLKPGSLSHFVISTSRRILSQLSCPSTHASMSELLGEVEGENVRSLRSTEKKLMLYIAPVCL